MLDQVICGHSKPVVLPPLQWVPTQAKQTRAHYGYHGHGLSVCLHRWAGGTYPGVVAEFKNPRNEASAHLVYAGEVGEYAGKCAQMVAVADASWTCAAYNGYTINVECADAMWLGHDAAGLHRAARITAFLCQHYKVPPTWVHDPYTHQGVVRHYDLGAAGGGHTDPTTDQHYWLAFMALVTQEYHRGDFLAHWTR